MDSTPITCPTQLLVEGNDPRNFFQAFIQQQYLDYELQVRNYGGISELRDYWGRFCEKTRFWLREKLGTRAGRGTLRAVCFSKRPRCVDRGRRLLPGRSQYAVKPIQR